MGNTNTSEDQAGPVDSIDQAELPGLQTSLTSKKTSAENLKYCISRLHNYYYVFDRCPIKEIIQLNIRVEPEETITSVTEKRVITKVERMALKYNLSVRDYIKLRLEGDKILEDKLIQVNKLSNKQLFVLKACSIEGLDVKDIYYNLAINIDEVYSESITSLASKFNPKSPTKVNTLTVKLLFKTMRTVLKRKTGNIIIERINGSVNNYLTSLFNKGTFAIVDSNTLEVIRKLYMTIYSDQEAYDDVENYIKDLDMGEVEEEYRQEISRILEEKRLRKIPTKD